MDEWRLWRCRFTGAFHESLGRLPQAMDEWRLWRCRVAGAFALSVYGRFHESLGSCLRLRMKGAPLALTKSGIPAATFQRQRRDLKIAWGNAPGTRDRIDKTALKARFNSRTSSDIKERRFVPRLRDRLNSSAVSNRRSLKLFERATQGLWRCEHSCRDHLADFGAGDFYSLHESVRTCVTQ
jgi:hypothetical protein